MSEHYDTTQKCPKCGPHHDTDDEWCDGLAATPCSLCGGLTMIPSDDPDGDIMNTPCPKCNEWSPDFKENPTGQEPEGFAAPDCSKK